jgi:soluble lytic murein transglycosylase-like protein
MKVRVSFFGCFLLSCLVCRAGEMVCLNTGFCIKAASHSVIDDCLTLNIGSGTIEIAANQIASIEPDTSSEQTKSSTSLPPQSLDSHALLAKAADEAGIDRDFVSSVAKVESGYRQNVVSNKGAIGLMQLMPGTAKEWNADPSAADQNAAAGAQYLRSLLVRYKGNSALALAAYNAGQGAVQKFGGVPPYRETAEYVLKVTREYDRLKHISQAKTLSKPSATN